MQKHIDFKLLYWLIIFTFLFIPVTSSFFISLKKLVKSVMVYNEYKKMINGLAKENKSLTNKLKYYKSSQGLKSLIKDRLNKVEEGELLIKINHQ